MIKYLFYCLLERVNNKPLMPFDYFIPKDAIEDITWAFTLFVNYHVRDLDHRDYDVTMELFTGSFEEIYYNLDLACSRAGKEEVGDIDYPRELTGISLNEVFYSGKYEYKDLNEVVNILYSKWINFQISLNEMSDAQRHYQVKRWGRLIRDVGEILAYLIERANVH